jgi:tetratricopeptide (TPR) repeat protein
VKVGPYEILGEVGRGGMGVVFRARSPTGRDVAVKLVRTGGSSAQRARFDRERRLLASLGEAEGFVPLLDAGDAREGPYFVMPFLGGGTLRDRLARGPLDLDDAIDVITQLARAIGLAHARGIVHRDLKPENVLFGRDGRPLVADLGLAKHYLGSAPGASASVSLSQAGQTRGTVAYMAPEQLSNAKDATPEADVFALGAILHEVLTGQPLFSGASVVELIQNRVLARVVPVRRLRPETPRWLAAVLARAITLAPEGRFPDGAALAEALDARVEPPVAWAVPVALASVLATTVVGIGVAVLAARPGPRAPSPAPKAVAPVKTVTHAAPGLSPSDEWVKKGVERGLAHDHRGALEALDKAVALDPKNPKAFFNRAVARLETGDPEGARADADRAVELAPEKVDVWTSRSGLREALDDPEGALADAAKAIEVDPSLAEGWMRRAALRVAKGDRDGAIGDATRAIELAPEGALGWCIRGTARYGGGDYAAAISDLGRAVELDPTLTRAWSNRASARVVQGDLDGGLADYGRAIELDGEDCFSRSNRGFLRKRLGDREGAIADLEHALTLRPNPGVARDCRAALAELKGPPR